MTKAYLSVDLGGTSLRMALLDEQGKILSQQTISSDLVRDEEGLIKVLSQETELFRFRAEKIETEIAGMALGIPGLVDSTQGLVLQSPHFPLWKDIALRDAFQNKFPFPVLMENDANQAALGEAWKGAGQDWPNFILLTLGTGIGGGIIQEGKIFHGPNGFAGEIGHIVIDRRGPTGALGSQGTLESLASQSGLKLQLGNFQNLQRLLVNDSTLPEKLFELAAAGDNDALKMWREMGAALGCGIASLSLAFGYDRFVIGGGLSAAWSFFEKSCREEAARRTYSALAPNLKIVPASLGQDAGLIGGVRRLILDK